ncbi:hypothetical protein ACFYPN_16295 [Streptomyces sp. NPDC005576]|uniref:hypothetical protein n=1 Tax=Streptomyces sp. NPDC005576 TaxID=3364726 RepID=UPI0036A44DA3
MTARPLAVGDVIHGFAHGAFGRDHYHCVRVEAVGPDWIVARNPGEPDWAPSFASSTEELGLCAQARDEGHQTPWGEPVQPCPLAGKVTPTEPLMDVFFVAADGRTIVHGSVIEIGDDGTLTVRSRQ